MQYAIKASSASKEIGSINIKQTEINFGTTQESANNLANPAELFLSAFAACILKNVERFSGLLKFEYTKAEITVNATRPEKPPRMDEISYELIIYSQDERLRPELLKKNVEKFGTIFNTVKASCTITGVIRKLPE